MARQRQYETDWQNERSERNDDPQSRREGGQHTQQAGRSGQQRGYGGQGGYGRDQSPYGRANEDFGRGMGDEAYAQSRPLSEDFGQDYGRGYGQGGQGPGRTQGYGGQGYGDQRRGGQSDERGFMERAGDELASWFGDDDAQRRRDADHRGKGPKGYTRSDERIREDVSDHLSDEPSVDASDIEVSVSEGEVTLSGTVSSRQSKRRAEDCIDRLAGVKHVQNNLRVKSQGFGGSTVGEGLSSDTRSGSTTGKASGQGNTQI